jgi:hypothetical protein
VADASAAGLNAECPSCHVALVIPEVEASEDAESDGPMVSQSEHTDTQLALAYACEQLEATQDQYAHLNANSIRVQAELRSLLVEKRMHLNLLGDYKRRLRIVEEQLVGSASMAAGGIGADGVESVEAPLSKSPQTIPKLGIEKSANMENRSECPDAELTEIRNRLEESEKTGRTLAGSCEELRRENAALLRALQEARGGNGRVAGSAYLERVHEDNGLLRGIVSRQNVLLEQWHAELASFKRARLMLRILYALFALCLGILAIIAINSWPLLKL